MYRLLPCCNHSQLNASGPYNKEIEFYRPSRIIIAVIEILFIRFRYGTGWAIGYCKSNSMISRRKKAMVCSDSVDRPNGRRSGGSRSTATAGRGTYELGGRRSGTACQCLPKTSVFVVWDAARFQRRTRQQEQHLFVWRNVLGVPRYSPPLPFRTPLTRRTIHASGVAVYSTSSSLSDHRMKCSWGRDQVVFVHIVPLGHVSYKNVHGHRIRTAIHTLHCIALHLIPQCRRPVAW